MHIRSRLKHPRRATRPGQRAFRRLRWLGFSNEETDLKHIRTSRRSRRRKRKHARSIWRNWKLGVGGWFILMSVLAVAIPGMIVKPLDFPERAVLVPWPRWQPGPSIPLEASSISWKIPVYRSGTGSVERMDLEMYVRGVVAAEMPIDFNLEALKAQAIAARTYVVKKFVDHDFTHVPMDAWVTDTVADQAYVDLDRLRQKWGWLHYGANLDKLSQAVNETRGLVAVYEGKPIQAAFFSTSNGFTENSEEYWTNYVPYLRSVPSPWDKQDSPKFKQQTSVSYSDLFRKLGISGVQATSASASVNMLSWTTGKRVKQINIAGQLFSGREVREKLGLPSSHFTIQHREDGVTITSYGYGHGVGMSQYGAEGMAREGKTAQQILSYYYSGIAIRPMGELGIAALNQQLAAAAQTTSVLMP